MNWKHSLIHWAHGKHGFLRTIAVIVTITFITLNLQPLAVAAETSGSDSPTSSNPPSDEEQLSKTLIQIERKLEKIEAKLEKKEDASLELNELEGLKQQLDNLHAKAIDNFSAIEQNLKDKNLSDVIMQRHYNAVDQYKSNIDTLKANLIAFDGAKDSEDRRIKAKKAKSYLKEKQMRKRHKSFDPNNLPFRVPDGKVRKPATSKEEFQQLGLFRDKRIQVATTELTPLMVAQATIDLPQPEHLQPTKDVQITQPIIDKANELNNNPVEIYNWVRNNIEFLPTYGSVQGSVMTLQTKQGNAFDTSSLLIALLRAANLPSRYVLGTIEVPADKVMNWIGGMESPEAALQLLGQGGIPSIGIVSGGKIVAIQMEHIWVEAWVDFVPSRGA